MAPREDLAALTTKVALAKNAVGKRKKQTPTAKDRDFRHLKRGPSTPKVVPLTSVERVGEGLPDHPATMRPSFLPRRSAGEGSSHSSKALPAKGSRGPYFLMM